MMALHETTLVMTVKYHRDVRCLELHCGHVVRDRKGDRIPGDIVVCQTCQYRKHQEGQQQ